jgi:hypothetical protein
MEFFTTAIIPASPADLKRRLTICDMPHWCASIETVLEDAKSSGEIFCIWGSFNVNRDEISHGVRFSFPRCSNALQWTVTTGHQPNPQHTFIHLTINRTEQDQDFIETIQQFMADWKAGLESHW